MAWWHLRQWDQLGAGTLGQPPAVLAPHRRRETADLVPRPPTPIHPDEGARHPTPAYSERTPMMPRTWSRKECAPLSCRAMATLQMR